MNRAEHEKLDVHQNLQMARDTTRDIPFFDDSGNYFHRVWQ